MAVVFENNVDDIVVKEMNAYSVLDSKKLTRKVLHDAEVDLRTTGKLVLSHKDNPDNRVAFIVGEGGRVSEKVVSSSKGEGITEDNTYDMDKSVTHTVNMLVYNLIGEGYVLTTLK